MHSPRRIAHLIAAAAIVLLAGCASQTTSSEFWISLPYENDFSGTCDLPSGDDAAWTHGCSKDSYRIVMKTVRLGIAHVGLKHATRSLTVQADVSLVRGVATTTQRDITNYGVACLIAGVADEPSGYLFVVGADGTWAILRKTPQGYDSLAVWKDQADLLPASSNARVGGTCVAVPNGPAVLRLQVNGKTVHTVEDDAPLGTFRRFGVLLLTSQPNSEARFDNLSAKP